MKAQIYINNKVVFQSSRISQKALDEKSEEIKREHGLCKVPDQVKNGYNVVTSY